MPQEVDPPSVAVAVAARLVRAATTLAEMAVRPWGEAPTLRETTRGRASTQRVARRTECRAEVLLGERQVPKTRLRLTTRGEIREPEARANRPVEGAVVTQILSGLSPDDTLNIVIGQGTPGGAPGRGGGPGSSAGGGDGTAGVRGSNGWMRIIPLPAAA